MLVQIQYWSLYTVVAPFTPPNSGNNLTWTFLQKTAAVKETVQVHQVNNWKPEKNLVIFLDQGSCEEIVSYLLSYSTKYYIIF